jgi:error-prone DNA polymerase
LDFPGGGDGGVVFARGVRVISCAELDVTSNFSFLRGASHPQEMVFRAAELGYSAIAITDLNSLAGVVRAHLAAKEAGIRLCIGARLRFTDAPDVLVWARDRAGYGNLCRLLTTGKRRTEKGSCTLGLEDLLKSPGGLGAAMVAQRIDPQVEGGNGDGLETAAAMLREAFGKNLSLAVSRLYGPEDDAAFQRIESLSHRCGVPLLASNQVHYHQEHRRALQDVVTCIRHGCTIQQAGWRLFPNGERFIKPPEEMRRLFADSPAALKRAMEAAEQCEFSLEELRYEYPDEIVPAGQTPISHLTELAWTGAGRRYPQGIPEKVRRLIAHELKLIEQLKIEAYFLTVYDLVQFARSRGILCQGRGSAANSAVCYCLEVTSVDPNRIDLLFERFVSAARDEPPDIDIDFEHERREEVIQYLYEKYGRERAGMTAEVISYRGRSAVRDVGKALGLGLDAVDAIAKSLNWWHSGPLSAEQLAGAGLDANDRTIQLLVRLTSELKGFPRHLSQHVGGMVMTRGPLCEMVPIENGSMEDRTVIEWDKDDIEAVGILKVDVLGLGMLTCISKAFGMLNKRHEGLRRAQSSRTKARRTSASSVEPHEGEEGGRRYKGIGGFYDADSYVSGLDCLAAGNEIGSGGLSSDSADAEIGTVRIDQSDATGGSVGSFEHRGGICPSEHAGLSQVSTDRTRVAGGIVNPIRTGDRTENAGINQKHDRSSSRGGPSPSGPDPKPGKEVNNPSPPSCGSTELAEVLRAFVPSCLPLELHTLPPEDPAVYDMICDADTIGVFQIESRAQMSMLPRLKPRKFYDLVIEVAIVRPGPIQGDMVHPYLRRRDGTETVHYPSEALKEVLKDTLGVPLFQEQAMKVVMVAAGFSAEEADQLRRAMAAWRYSGHIESFHRKIVDGMLANGYTPEFAEQCFNQIKGFGEYGFPESHAASFALLVYASVWIKRHHPAAFCCALLNSQPMGFYQPAQIVRDAREHGVEVRPIDVNFSEWDCTLEERHEGLRRAQSSRTEARRHEGKERWGCGGPAVRLGMRLIKGMQSLHAQRIAECRGEGFRSIEHFQRATKLPRSAIERLAEADAFSSLPRSRRIALWQTIALTDENIPLFEEHGAENSSGAPLAPMPLGQEVMFDYATAGLSLKQHPVALVREQLNRRKIITASQLKTRKDGWVRVAGIVLVRQHPGTANGIVFVTLEDETGVANLIIRPNIFERYAPAVCRAYLLQADGYVERQGQVIHVMALRFDDLSHLLAGYKFHSRDFQ